MVIAFCCTRTWYKYLLVSLFALLSTNEVKKIYLFIEDDTLQDLDNFKNFKTKFIVYNYNDIMFKHPKIKKLNIENKYTSAALIRLFIADILEEDKVIYLDTDTLVISSIDDLWNIRLGENYLAGVKDDYVEKFADHFAKINLPGNIYINSGVLLMNLKKMRVDELSLKFGKELSKNVYFFPDQDSINKVCINKIKIIDAKYNSSESTGFPEDRKIIHYVNDKSNWVKDHPLGEIWYKWEERYHDFLNLPEYDRSLEIDLLIPIYNGKKYLTKALSSIAKQTIKDKVLVTIIDDGSKEDYADILGEFERTLNINYIKYKKNKGVGFAREYGIRHTILPYITWLDCDDEFADIYALERLFNIIKRNKICKVVLSRKHMLDTNKDIYDYANLYGKIYLRKKIEELDIHFKYKRAYEDVLYNYMFFKSLATDEIEFIDSTTIIYKNENKKSLSKEYIDIKYYLENMKDIYKNTKNVINKEYIISTLEESRYFYKNNSFKDERQMTEFKKILYKYYMKVKPLVYTSLLQDKYDLLMFLNELNNW